MKKLNVPSNEKIECTTKCVNTILNLLEIIPQLGMSDKDKCQCGKPTCITAKGYYKSGHGGVGTFILHKFEGKR